MNPGLRRIPPLQREQVVQAMQAARMSFRALQRFALGTDEPDHRLVEAADLIQEAARLLGEVLE